jgi:hypothetical protein
MQAAVMSEVLHGVGLQFTVVECGHEVCVAHTATDIMM